MEQSLHHCAVPKSLGGSPHDLAFESRCISRVSKRKRENDAAIEELELLQIEAKKRRVLPRKEPNVSDDLGEPEVDFAKGTLDLCVSEVLRLELETFSAPAEEELSDGVFFGVRSLLTTTSQEAKITVK